MELEKDLRDWLVDATRLAVLAVGSELRGDDAAGILAGQVLETKLQSVPARIPCQVFLGHSAPENLTGAIRQFRPSHLILLDAAQLDAAPGQIATIPPDKVADAASASTHSLPLTVLMDYLAGLTGCKCLVIGIQPAGCQLGMPPSPAIAAAARALAEIIAQSIR